MVRSCAAYGCKNRYKKGVSFHKFPLHNKELLQKWIISVRRAKWKPSPTSVLCGEHFKKEDFVPSVTGCHTLKDGVVPSVFNFPEHLKKKAGKHVTSCYTLKEGSVPSMLHLKKKAGKPVTGYYTLKERAMPSVPHLKKKTVKPSKSTYAEQHQQDDSDPPSASDMVKEDDCTSELKDVTDDHSYHKKDDVVTLKRKLEEAELRNIQLRKKLKALKECLRRRNKSVVKNL